MKRPIYAIASFLRGFVVVLFVSMSLDCFSIYGPQLLDRVFSRSVKARCGTFSTATNQDAVIEKIDGWYRAASFQQLYDNSIEFWEKGQGACKITVDPITHRVLNIDFQPDMPPQWNIIEDSYPGEE